MTVRRRTSGRAPSVGLIGFHGHGTAHLRELERLADAGLARLAACADVLGPDDKEATVLRRLGAAYFADWRAMLAGGQRLDTVVVASPPHLHTEMVLGAMEAGAQVLVEKPPVVTMSDFEQLVSAARRNGTACQVGFQSAGSAAVPLCRELAAAGELGEPLVAGAWGAWQRDHAYWCRSEWAGRRVLHGREVRDGALSNPFAHAVMNCLLVLGDGATAGEVRTVEVERYRANAIEVEDTASLRVSLSNGRVFVVAVTLCAEEVRHPELCLSGSSGKVVWSYRNDDLTVDVRGARRTVAVGRTSLLEELLDFQQGRTGTLSCPLASCRSFVEVVEAVQAAPVAEVAAHHLQTSGEGEHRRAVIVGVDGAVAQAARQQKLFSELGVAWAAS